MGLCRPFIEAQWEPILKIERNELITDTCSRNVSNHVNV